MDIIKGENCRVGKRCPRDPSIAAQIPDCIGECIPENHFDTVERCKNCKRIL